MSSSKRRVHVLPAQGKATIVGREIFWAILSRGEELPESLDAPPKSVSRVDDRLIIASSSGRDPYIGEILGEGWYECKACSQRRYCSAWDGIGYRMRGVPLGIMREGDRVDGDQEQLLRLGLIGSENIRNIANGSSVILDAMEKMFGFVAAVRSVTPTYSPEALAAASELNLTLPTTREAVEASYRKLAFRYHPDNKDHGSNAKFVAVGQARDLLLKML